MINGGLDFHTLQMEDDETSCNRLILKDLGRFLSILCLGPRVFVAHNSSVCCVTHGYETQNCAWYCHVSPNDDFTWFPKMGIPKMDGLHGNSYKSGWLMGTIISRNSHIIIISLMFLIWRVTYSAIQSPCLWTRHVPRLRAVLIPQGWRWSKPMIGILLPRTSVETMADS